MNVRQGSCLNFDDAESKQASLIERGNTAGGNAERLINEKGLSILVRKETYSLLRVSKRMNSVDLIYKN